jgi:hypothetical protein
MQYAALIRPVIDRVYVGMRAAVRDRTQQVVEQTGLRPGFSISFYFGLLARPMSAAGFAAATTYSGSDMTDELEQGIAVVDGFGTWELTATGRALALALQRAIADGAEEFWNNKHIATMPGLAVLPRLAELLGTLLQAGAATGGPAFTAMSPVYEPSDASPALRVTSRMGALRHHRADAHRAAWAAAGLTLPELLALRARPTVRNGRPSKKRRTGATHRSTSPLRAGTLGVPRHPGSSAGLKLLARTTKAAPFTGTS